jgi:hypothetical protein
MNRTLVVGADRANPMDAAAIRHRLNIRPTFVHAKDDRTARAPLCEVLAANAMAVGGFSVEQSHFASHFCVLATRYHGGIRAPIKILLRYWCK